MRSIGFSKSTKPNEKRRAILLEDIKDIKNKKYLYFQKGYGDVVGYSDQDILDMGCNVCSYEEILNKDVVCDCKIGDAEYLKDLKEGTIIFGWVHVVRNKDIAQIVIDRNLTAIAWEDMFENARHVFWRNNELAGESAIMHAYMLYGKMPYNTKVALIGRGNVAIGAYKILNSLGADVTVYSRRDEELLSKELPKYDVIVNAVYWSIKRDDHIINKEDLKRMKKNSMIIDISCDEEGAIETSIPTTMEEPIYFKEGIMHYVVDHTPSIFYKTTSIGISSVVSKYLDSIIEEKEEEDEVLKNAICIKNGKIIDQRIVEFHKEHEEDDDE